MSDRERRAAAASTNRVLSCCLVVLFYHDKNVGDPAPAPEQANAALNNAAFDNSPPRELPRRISRDRCASSTEFLPSNTGPQMASNWLNFVASLA
jgi:hypothetical protein